MATGTLPYTEYDPPSPPHHSYGHLIWVKQSSCKVIRVIVGNRVCSGYLLFDLSLVRSVLVQDLKGKPPVATGEKDEPWAPVVSVATGTLPYTEYDPPSPPLHLQDCKGKPPVATEEKDEPWVPVDSVATGTLPYTEYDPLSSSPLAGL